MLTTTRVEAIVIDSDDGSSTFFRNGGDLVIDLKKGRALRGSRIWTRTTSRLSKRITRKRPPALARRGSLVYG